MLPGSYEVELLQTQLRKGAGMFRCNGFDVLSNQYAELSPGPPRIGTAIVPGSLKCEIGGKWMTALNSEIFVRVWKKVISMARFKRYGWTVKVDPDCVFLTWRLQDHLQGANPEDEVYLNNFKEGLHGPIEILSRKAMEVYGEGLNKCVDALSFEFTTYGEDVFLRHCLGMLEVNRVDDFTLLTETFDHSLPKCGPKSIAFHPLKTVDSWFACLAKATK